MDFFSNWYEFFLRPMARVYQLYTKANVFHMSSKLTSDRANNYFLLNSNAYN